jgi:hypothetical protein
MREISIFPIRLPSARPRKMHLRPLAVLIAVLAAAPAAAAQQTQPYRSDAGYTVQLPASWRRMPEAELREVRRAAAASGMPLTIEAAYRIKRGADLPFAAIARMDLGETVTREDFGAAVAGASSQAAMQEAVDQTPAARLGGRMDVPVWDEENGIIWARMGMRSDGRSPSFSWSTATLHADGRTMIAFVYYGDPATSEAQARADLLAMMRSIRAD